MYRKKHYPWSSVLPVASGMYWGSWKVFPMDKGDYCTCNSLNTPGISILQLVSVHEAILFHLGVWQLFSSSSICQPPFILQDLIHWFICPFALCTPHPRPIVYVHINYLHLNLENNFKGKQNLRHAGGGNVEGRGNPTALCWPWGGCHGEERHRLIR